MLEIDCRLVHESYLDTARSALENGHDRVVLHAGGRRVIVTPSADAPLDNSGRPMWPEVSFLDHHDGQPWTPIIMIGSESANARGISAKYET